MLSERSRSLPVGPPLASAAVLSVMRPVARDVFFFPPRATWRFSARRALRVHGGFLPAMHSEVHGGFLPRRPAHCPPPSRRLIAAPWGPARRPLPSPRRGALGARASPPPVASSRHLGGPRAAPSRCLVAVPWGPARRPLLSPRRGALGTRVSPPPIARRRALGGLCAAPPPVAHRGALEGTRTAPPGAREPPLQPTQAAPAAREPPFPPPALVELRGGGYGGGGCVRRHLLLLLLRLPLLQLPLRGGGCVGAAGVALGGCRGCSARGTAGGV
ncbi:unnamed protein product [Closterium sp. NIES-54]